MTYSRRKFLKAMGATSLATAAFSASPAMFSAHAADVSGYKAMVCVFLFGGLDSHDLILPYDQPSYSSIANIRQTLFGQTGSTRARDQLLPLSPGNAGQFGGRQFALPPEMPLLRDLFNQGKAAFVGNVGPLIEPVSRTAFEAGGVRLPPRLFSHNDQQATWQASAPEGAQFGWGGLFADAILASGGATGPSEFATIATTESGPFLTGNTATPYQVSTRGSAEVFLLEPLSDPDLNSEARALFEQVQRVLRTEPYAGNHVVEGDIANLISGGFDANAAYNDARSTATPLTTSFPATPLGSQLRAIADTIAIRGSLQTSRQIFFAGRGGFDTHDAQAQSLPQLLGEIDMALAAFNAAMIELGLSDDVVLFTASDFGRTLAVNGDGTDHGWGGHQIVMGGGVVGNQILGTIPEPVFGHEQDSGGGRLIPELSVEQYAANFGRWFGLSDSELDTALPNLTNFDRSALNLFG